MCALLTYPHMMFNPGPSPISNVFLPCTITIITHIGEALGNEATYIHVYGNIVFVLMQIEQYIARAESLKTAVREKRPIRNLKPRKLLGTYVHVYDCTFDPQHACTVRVTVLSLCVCHLQEKEHTMRGINGFSLVCKMVFSLKCFV